MTRTLTLALLLAPASALAWNHTQQVWMPNNLPLEYLISDYEEDSLPAGYAQASIQDGYAAWEVAECADVPTTFAGSISENTGFLYDFENRHTFDDPADTVAPGVLGVTLTLPPTGVGAPVFIRDGLAYYQALDSDIVYNDNVDWETDEDIKAGNCSGGHSFRAVSTHEIGHQLGLAHSCEQDEICTDPEFLDATMFWSVGPCDADNSEIAVDDVQSLQSLYGPQGSFRCSHELQPGNDDTIAVGNVPFNLKCTIDTDRPEELADAQWFFGDGTVVEGEFETAHTYTEAGNYTVRVCFQGDNEACGEWEYCFRREGYVRACDVPDVAFSLNHVNGRTYDFFNDTDISTYGCIFDVQWDVFQGNRLVDSISAWEPTYTFEEDGDYRVVLNVGGPAGTGADELELTVTNRRGADYGGCSTTGVPGGAGLALLALAGLASRRRRR